MPRAGDPVTLYPINQNGLAALPDLLSGTQTRLIAKGPLRGSYVVTGGLPGFGDLLFNYGVLPLNAAAPGCGPISSLKGAQ